MEVDVIASRETTKTENPTKPKPAGKSVKASKKAKSTKEPKPKKEKAPKQPVVVFAFRLSESDRTHIHTAAGSGKATKFVRAAALAAANADIKAFEALVSQAKANQK